MNETPDDRDPPRLVRPDGRVDIERVGMSRPGFFRDFYHLSIRLSWARFLSMLVAGWVGTNLAFGLAYYLGGPNWISGSDGSFLSAFFFSVQTLSTIGYGAMSPVSVAANLLVTVQALVGLLMTAIATGLFFARFSTPTAQVIFTRNLLISNHGGERMLMFRIANARESYLVDARVSVTMLRDEITEDGERLRRFIDLDLVRCESPVLALGWSIFHRIDESSPLHGMDGQALRDNSVAFWVSLQGVDERLEQGVHARRAYDFRDVVFDMRFRDTVLTRPDGRPYVDYAYFHVLEPLEADKNPSEERITRSAG